MFTLSPRNCKASQVPTVGKSARFPVASPDEQRRGAPVEQLAAVGRVRALLNISISEECCVQLSSMVLERMSPEDAFGLGW